MYYAEGLPSKLILTLVLQAPLGWFGGFLLTKKGAISAPFLYTIKVFTFYFPLASSLLRSIAPSPLRLFYFPRNITPPLIFMNEYRSPTGDV